MLKNMRKRIPEFAGMTAGDKVIDVCCGTGEQVLEYGRRGIIATGIDINPGMLKIAARNSMKHRAINVSFQLADAAELPFKDGFFDYASVSLGLHDKETQLRGQIISELKRVTREDGTIILIDFHAPLPQNLWALIARVIELFAGITHYHNFKEYIKNNGLDEIINKHGLKETDNIRLMNGLLIATKAEIRGVVL
jgi:ubiquinone/menaquinone biosynthesis C-methylase UbiE